MKWWALLLSAAACNGSHKSATAGGPTAAATPSAAAAATVSAKPPASRPPSPVASASPARGDDAIDALVHRLSTMPLWQNGLSPQLELPASATPAEVVAAMFRKISFDPGPVKSHRVVESRTVRIGADPEAFTAVLLDTDQGPMVALLRHESARVGWWTRVYPARP